MRARGPTILFRKHILQWPLMFQKEAANHVRKHCKLCSDVVATQLVMAQGGVATTQNILYKYNDLRVAQ